MSQKDVTEMSGNNNIDMGQFVSDFKKWGGNNYRIEKSDPKERAKYEELKKAETNDKNSPDAITLPEYLTYLQKTQPQLKIPSVDIEIAIEIDSLKNDKDGNIRNAAAEALGDHGDKSAVPALIDAMKIDSRWYVRGSAANALGKLGDKSAMPALIEAMKNDKAGDGWVCMAAAKALGKLGDKSAVPALIEAIKNDKAEDGLMCMAAAGALQKIQSAFSEQDPVHKEIEKALKDGCKP